MSYTEFLETKRQLADRGGFEPTDLPAHLFGFQRLLVEWAVRQGRGALFADCGLGKTPMEFAWAEQVHGHTGRPVLMLAPLAVGFQLVTEATKFGVDAATSRDGRIAAPITITNYERLERFNAEDFGGVVCDESSAIKSFDGVRRAMVTEFLRTAPYRLLGTATAAPNDYTELGTSSEALGHLGHIDMLNRFFVNDNRTSDTRNRGHTRSAGSRGGGMVAGGGSGFRFKGHAQQPFWRWVSSWARAIRKPSDYGFEDGGFILPPLEHRLHIVEANRPKDGTLFDVPAVGLQEEREELRRTLPERCAQVGEVLADAETSVAWCHLNDESSRLAKLIDGAVELTGSDPLEAKEEKLRAFSDGQIRVLVTKPIIGAWGLNWQHCNRMAFFPSHSYEQYYQAVRRSWRFGQTRPVTVDVITTTGGAKVLANLQRKATQAGVMFDSLIEHMSAAVRLDQRNTYDLEMAVPSWLK